MPLSMVAKRTALVPKFGYVVMKKIFTRRFALKTYGQADTHVAKRSKQSK